jgi:F-type H+-transporting ATPase subunit c
MSKKLVFLILVVMILAATPVFAQGTTTPAADQSGLKWIGIGIGMGIASGLCALGQGKATAGACEAMARNPGNTAAIRLALILGLALIESLALYTFAIVYGK